MMPKLKYSELEDILSQTSLADIENDEDESEWFPEFEFEDEITRLEEYFDYCDSLKRMSLMEFFDEVYAPGARVHTHLGNSVDLLRDNQRWIEEELPKIKAQFETIKEVHSVRYAELTRLKKIWETRL